MSEAPGDSGPGLRGRIRSGAKAQLFANSVRIAIQLGGITVLLPLWGLERYGEWLIITAVPTYMAFSDLGFFSAASNDMVMAEARGERDHARDVFRATARGAAAVLTLLAAILAALAWTLPLPELLNLGMSETTAATAVTLLGFNTLLIGIGTLLYGGFTAAGHYGDGAATLAGVTLCEFAAVVVTVAIGGNPALAAASMLFVRTLGTALMYHRMRRRAPWLSLGRPVGKPRVLKRLTKPALAATVFPTGLAINIQGTLVLIGVVAGPAAAAVFGTVRTISRIVIQVLGSIFAVVAPEFAKAFAAQDYELLRRLHRRACQAALWVCLPIVAFLAVFGVALIEALTGGRVEVTGGLLYVFLAATALDVLWYTSFAVLFSTNRHQRIAVVFLIAYVLALPLTYALHELWGLTGAALALALLEAFMLVAVLRQSLPAAHDRLGPWLRVLVTPPRPSALRAQLRGT